MWLVNSLLHFPPRVPKPHLDTRLMSERVVLRMGDPADWRQWRAVRGLSQDFLQPWEPSWPDNALDYGFFCGLLRRQWLDWRARARVQLSDFRSLRKYLDRHIAGWHRAQHGRARHRAKRLPWLLDGHAACRAGVDDGGSASGLQLRV